MEIIQGKIYNKEYYPELDLYDFYCKVFKQHADKTAFSYRLNPKDKTIIHKTYKETEADIKVLAMSLQAQDPTPRVRRIAVVGVNSYTWCLTYLSTVMHLGVIVPLDPLLPASELLPLLKRAEVDTFICDASYMPKLGEDIQAVSCLEHKYYMSLAKESAKTQTELLKSAKQFGYEDFANLLSTGYELLAQNKELRKLDIRPETMASLLFTSGTTSTSKAVMLSHYNITSDMTALLRVITMPERVRHLCLLPLHHCFENTCGLQCVLALGGQICMCDGLRYLSSNLAEYRPQLLIGVPAVYDALYKKIFTTLRKQKKLALFNFMRKVSKFLLSIGIDARRKIFKQVLAAMGGDIKIGITGAAPIRKEIVDFFFELGIDVLQGYGLTECAPVVAGCNTFYSVAGSSGQPLGGLTIAVDNEKDGEDGELLVKINPYPSMDSKPEEREINITMLGYYQDEQATKDTLLDNGWLRTFDVVHITPETQVIEITGRVKSMIVLHNGKKVFPEELEEQLERNDLVKRALVWGESLPDSEVILLARVQVDSDYVKENNLSDEQVRSELTQITDSLSRNLPSFKKLRSLYYSTSDMISTTTMKVKRKAEREKVLALLAANNVDFKKGSQILNLDNLTD